MTSAVLPLKPAFPETSLPPSILRTKVNVLPACFAWSPQGHASKPHPCSGQRVRGSPQSLPPAASALLLPLAPTALSPQQAELSFLIICLTPAGPRIEAPPLQRPADPGDATVTVFWHLTYEGLEAILTGQVAPAPSATSDPTLSPAAGEVGEAGKEGTDRAAQRDGEGAGGPQEEEDFGYAAWRSKLDPYVVAKAAEAQEMARERREMARQGAGAAGDVPEEEGGGAAHGKAALTSAQRLAAAARKLRQTLAEVYAVDSSVLVYAPRSLLDRVRGLTARGKGLKRNGKGFEGNGQEDGLTERGRG